MRRTQTKEKLPPVPSNPAQDIERKAVRQRPGKNRGCERYEAGQALADFRAHTLAQADESDAVTLRVTNEGDLR